MCACVTMCENSDKQVKELEKISKYLESKK